MSALVAAALCLLAADAGRPIVHASGVSIQSDDPRAGVEEAARAWRAEELASEELTARLIAFGRPAEPFVVELLVAARRAKPGELPVPLPVAALASALRSIGGQASLGPLIDVLGSTSEEERAAAADAIGGLGLAGGLVPLLDALNDESSDVRAAAGAAVLAVGKVHPDFALVGALEARWDRFDRRDQLGIVLGKLGTDAARAALRSKLAWYRAESEVLSALGGLWLCADENDGETALELLVSTDSLAVRRKTCLLLGRLRYGPAVRALIDLLYEEERGLVRDAHWALTRITGQPLRPDVELWECWWDRTGERRDQHLWRSP